MKYHRPHRRKASTGDRTAVPRAPGASPPHGTAAPTGPPSAPPPTSAPATA